MNKVIQVLRNHKLTYLAQYSSIFVFQKAKNQKHNLVPILSKNAQNTTLLKVFPNFLFLKLKHFFRLYTKHRFKNKNFFTLSILDTIYFVNIQCLTKIQEKKMELSKPNQTYLSTTLFVQTI